MRTVIRSEWHFKIQPQKGLNVAKELSSFLDSVQFPHNNLYQARALTPPSMEEITTALQCDATARRILGKGVMPQDGELVGVRLNINVLKHTGVAVHSIHKATSKNGHALGHGFYRGEVLNYLNVVVLREAFFNVHQGGREGIASGRMAKHPMASIDGRFIADPGPVTFDGVEVSFNPMRSHLFVDAENKAVQFADEVTILGHRAYLRGLIRYYTADTAPARAGSSPSCARFRA